MGRTINSEVLEEGNELPTDALGLDFLRKLAQVVSCSPPDHGSVVPAQLSVQAPQLGPHLARASVVGRPKEATGRHTRGEPLSCGKSLQHTIGN